MTMPRELMWIGGEPVEASTGQWREVDDPSLGEPFAEVPEAGSDDADRAVAAARAAFDGGPWARWAPEERRAALGRLHQILLGRLPELSELLRREVGSTLRTAGMFQVAGIGWLPAYADQALLLRTSAHALRDEDPLASFGLNEVERLPLGVCVGITPFNAPLIAAIFKAGPALAMGNTMVLKPSPLTPLSSIALARAATDAGIPPGVLNVVTGDREPAERLVAHPDVDLVTFTGSTATGRKVLEGAAGTIKRVTLELGGKSPSIILDDADLDLAVQGSLFSLLINSGQSCVAGSRLLVPARRYDEVLDRVRELVAMVRVGRSDDSNTDVGPLASADQLARVEAHVASALAQGAKLLTGGRRPPGLDRGWFYEPTVLVDVENHMDVACQEIFGPVLSVIRYDGDDEAVAVANDTMYGLAAVVWGGDLRRARAVAHRLRAGIVWINDFGPADPWVESGGFKQSGLGYEGGEQGALAFTQLRRVYTALDQDVRSRIYPLVCTQWAQ